MSPHFQRHHTALLARLRQIGLAAQTSTVWDSPTLSASLVQSVPIVDRYDTPPLAYVNIATPASPTVRPEPVEFAALAAAYQARDIRDWMLWLPILIPEPLPAAPSGYEFCKLMTCFTRDLYARPVQTPCIDRNIDHDGTVALLGQVNADAFATATLANALSLAEPYAATNIDTDTQQRIYSTRAANETTAALSMLVRDGTASLAWLATRRKRRGLGYASALVAKTLHAAKTLGCTHAVALAPPDTHVLTRAHFFPTAQYALYRNVR